MSGINEDFYVSTPEILAELPKLTRSELEAVESRLVAAGVGPPFAETLG